jgi:hypothetical protein
LGLFATKVDPVKRCTIARAYLRRAPTTIRNSRGEDDEDDKALVLELRKLTEELAGSKK